MKPGRGKHWGNGDEVLNRQSGEKEGVSEGQWTRLDPFKTCACSSCGCLVGAWSFASSVRTTHACFFSVNGPWPAKSDVTFQALPMPQVSVSTSGTPRVQTRFWLICASSGVPFQPWCLRNPRETFYPETPTRHGSASHRGGSGGHAWYSVLVREETNSKTEKKILPNISQLLCHEHVLLKCCLGEENNAKITSANPWQFYSLKWPRDVHSEVSVLHPLPQAVSWHP